MTGFCVAVVFDATENPDDVAATMASAAPHRGHQQSRWSKDGAALVSQRDDSSAASLLELHDLVCVVDGRFDDWGPLFDAAEPAGRPTAAEVAVAAYRRWGSACATRLTGDFAFVIWDPMTRHLFAARDQMGARTLYYRVEPGRRVLVASEAKQLLAAPRVPCRLNEAALLADIAGLYALPRMTPYEGIEQLPPAHALSVEARDHRTWRYWDLDHGRRIRFRDTREYADQLRHLFTMSVRDRLRDGQPAGAFLSGGLDSMATVATAARVQAAQGSSTTLRGYSWAFDELTDADERQVSGPVAEELGVAVTSIPADMAWPLSGGAEFGPDRDDPYVSLYEPLMEHTLAAARSGGVRTMFTTDRGDELLGNWVYDELGLALTGRWRMLAEDRREYLTRTGQSGARFMRERLLGPLATTAWPPHVLVGLRTRLAGVRAGAPRTLAPWVPVQAAQRLGLRDVMEAAVPIPPVRGHARMQRFMSVFDVISLRIAQLRSRTFARYGLEYADPWADRRIAEFICAIPQWVVQRQSEPKRLGKAAMEGVLPDAARLRPAPSNLYGLFRRAFNEREVDTVRELLQTSRAHKLGLLDAGAVLREYETYLTGGDLAHDFWFPLTVELWLRRWWD